METDVRNVQTEAALRGGGVQRACSTLAEGPQDGVPFPAGRGLALALGYPPELLEGLPAVAVDAFAGVSCVFLFADIPEGAVVLDVGCGAGWTR